MKKVSTFFALIVLSACAVSDDARTTITLFLDDETQISIVAEIADEPSERQKGLMFRDHLADGNGMIFVFEEEKPRSFWMKNTLIPLDILYFDASGVLVSALTMQPCTADPCMSYPSNASAQYALEVNEGFIKKYNISVGDVKITPLL